MVEQAIHEIINDASISDAVALLALLPADRIVTGINHNRDLPYASISLESDGAEYRSSGGSVREQRFRFQLWHDNHASGAAIREAVQTLFENKSFDTSPTRIISSRHENSLAIQEENGVWQFLIDIQIVSTREA